MSALLALGTLAAFALGYRFYARYLGRRIYGDEEDVPMPSHQFEDGRDYVPTKAPILFGHHFTSIAGAAPIIGPCVAAYWGWLPALVWVVLGTIFMGATHDFGALVVSVRERGRSIGDVTGTLISPRARIMFLVFILLLVWLVLAVFSMAIAGLFVAQPSSVIPINAQIVVAVAVGLLLYRRGVPALLPSLVALVLLLAFVWVGTRYPLPITELGLDRKAGEQVWIVFLLLYSAVASLLPVWLLLQPRDYINSHLLFLGLGLIFLGVFVAHPEVDAPAFRAPETEGPSLFPLLFVTVACGAISGFHGLVASGTTSKQLDRLRHARPIGYGSMLGEGTLALASTLAAVAGIALVGSCALPGQGAVADLSWAVYYDSWAHAGQNKAAAFVLGGGALLETVGLPPDLARTLMAVIVIAFAATSLDTGTRIQRLILGELGAALRIRALENAYVATALAVLPAGILAFARTVDPVSGNATEVGWVLWPIFGASNQMLAALTLMVLTLYFWSRKRPVLPLLIPMLFVMTVTLVALVAKLGDFVAQDNPLLATLAALLLGLIGWMMVEGLLVARRGRAA